jgi:hypothetical protein
MAKLIRSVALLQEDKSVGIEVINVKLKRIEC